MGPLDMDLCIFCWAVLLAWGFGGVLAGSAGVDRVYLGCLWLVVLFNTSRMLSWMPGGT